MANSNGVQVANNGPIVRMGTRRQSDEMVAEVSGKLTYFEVRAFDSKENPGTPNYKHEITLEAGRQVWKCIMWDEQVIDISELEGERVTFGVSYFKDDQYGRPIGNSQARVIAVGKLPKGVRDQFAK